MAVVRKPMSPFVMPTGQYRVIAAAFVCTRWDGTDVYLYTGNMVPAGTDPAVIAHALKSGLIELVQEVQA